MTSAELNDGENIKSYLVEWSTWTETSSPSAAATIARDLIVNGAQTIFVVGGGITKTVIDAEDGGIIVEEKDTDE